MGATEISVPDVLVREQIKTEFMKKTELDIQKLREQIRKVSDLIFQKLVTQKKAQNGILVLSENGQIKKIYAAGISNKSDIWFFENL